MNTIPPKAESEHWLGLLEQLSEYEHPLELRARVAELVGLLGFERFAIVRTRLPLTRPELIYGRFDKGWRCRYLLHPSDSEARLASLALANDSPTPQTWSRQQPTSVVQLRPEKRCRPLKGISFPVQTIASGTAVIGFSIARYRRADMPLHSVAVPFGQLLSNHLAELSERVFVGPPRNLSVYQLRNASTQVGPRPPTQPALSAGSAPHSPGRPNLNRLELQCLSWAAAGKNPAEIAQTLALAEATVNFHLENVKRKFNTSSGDRAILQAVALGMIDASDRPQPAAGNVYLPAR